MIRWDDFRSSWAIGIWFVVPFVLVGYLSQFVAALSFGNALLFALPAGLLCLFAGVLRSATLGEGIGNGPPIRERENEPILRKSAITHTEKSFYKFPDLDFLRTPPDRIAFNTEELQTIAAKIRSTFEEFNVRGSVTQINPGPVVTTFEFKPEPGIKYSRIITLAEALCMRLHADSILIERIPGKPTIGIEVPNSKREIISLREILESDEFHNSPSPLTLAIGKDISGRIRVATLDAMPHLLIAGSTGSGKRLVLNSLIMSILYKSTPEQVRLILLGSERSQFDLYEGIPHLLTPVTRDTKEGANILRYAVIEMERRLKLLASQGVRNIERYNTTVRQLAAQKNLFEHGSAKEPLEPLPYLMIVIDELADLMLLERASVEESITRLAQMARTVGMHLVLATERPSVDVITGLIKANFPSRMSFRVATRVDSRTVLDVMGAEHLLGDGDMLFLPPGSSRLVRLHTSFVSEVEIAHVVEFWRRQAEPDADRSFWLPPLSGSEDQAAALDEPVVDLRSELDDPLMEVTQDSSSISAIGTESDPLFDDAIDVIRDVIGRSAPALKMGLGIDYWRAVDLVEAIERKGIPAKIPPESSRERPASSSSIRGHRQAEK